MITDFSADDPGSGMQETGLGTIVSSSYAPLARALMHSVALQDPSVERYVLLLDESVAGESLLRAEGVKVLHLTDLDLTEEELAVRRHIYSVVEFATSMKPLFLRAVLLRHSRAVYLDPDVKLFSSLTASVDLNTEVELHLTPHRISPPPLDRLQPSEDLFSKYGVFNLGFVGVNQTSLGALDWWNERLRRHAISSASRRLFTDQKWMDFAPCYFRVNIIRHKGWNVAPWNLDERPAACEAGVTMVGDGPLVFAHFSGFRPWNEASSPADEPVYPSRALLRPESVSTFDLLAREWSNEVLSEGASLLTMDYSGDFHSDGARITQGERRRFRRRVLRAEDNGFSAPQPKKSVRLLPEKWMRPLGSLALADALPAAAREDGLRIRARLNKIVRTWRRSHSGQ